MTHADIKAALTLAAEAKVRADELTRDRPPREFRRLAVDDVLRIARSLQDVPVLADLVRRLADELLTVCAVLSDATSESAMHRHGYERGIRDALAVLLLRINEDESHMLRPDMPMFRRDELEDHRDILQSAANAIRALLPP